jgi:hypothetical protein
MINEWVNKSPRWLAAFWIAGFRLVWALYWFGMTAKVAMSQPALAIVPIVISCLMAVTVGYYLGYTIALTDRTKSYWAAGLKGIVVEHLITILYLPVAVLITSLIEGKNYFSGLYFSYILSIAGIPIHTVIGALAGILLYYIAKRNRNHA